jgi:hypothetical protein
MLAFTAKGVAATRLVDENVLVVVLAEDPDDADGPRLEIACMLKYSRQDRELGQDTYSLSTQTGATTYGGVRWYTLEGSTFTINLDTRAQDQLGVDEEFSILLDAGAATIQEVRSALVRILGMESGLRAV